MVEMENMRYAADKPKECKYCYFWNWNKNCCSLTMEQCYYILPPKEKLKPKSVCDGCAYAKNAPCIGYCMRNILDEQKGKRGNKK